MACCHDPHGRSDEKLHQRRPRRRPCSPIRQIIRLHHPNRRPRAAKRGQAAGDLSARDSALLPHPRPARAWDRRRASRRAMAFGRPLAQSTGCLLIALDPKEGCSSPTSTPTTCLSTSATLVDMFPTDLYSVPTPAPPADPCSHNNLWDTPCWVRLVAVGATHADTWRSLYPVKLISSSCTPPLHQVHHRATMSIAKSGFYWKSSSATRGSSWSILLFIPITATLLPARSVPADARPAILSTCSAGHGASACPSRLHPERDR